MTAVHVVATGVANLASVRAAFARLGHDLVPVTGADAVAEATALILPGVGHFGAARSALQAGGVAAALRRRLAAGRATLGICLGMQLCCEASDEAPEAAGLGFLPGRVQRFADGVRSPQMGWNRVVADPTARLLRDGHAYFANSYRLTAPPAGFACAVAEHGGPFVAAVERGAVLFCQFHPELSGTYGEELLRRWLAVAAEIAC